MEPGEAIQEAFVVSGRHPDAAGQPGAQGRRVVVTDRATLLLIPNRKTPLRWDCTRLPRTKLGPWQGLLWTKVLLGGERHWVFRMYRQSIENADSLVS